MVVLLAMAPEISAGCATQHKRIIGRYTGNGVLCVQPALGVAGSQARGACLSQGFEYVMTDAYTVHVFVRMAFEFDPKKAAANPSG